MIIPPGVTIYCARVRVPPSCIMRVRLIDIDNKYREPRRRGHRFPNLALMKWSAYYKARGDLVAFDLPDPDITVMACVFPRNYPHALREATLATTPLTWGGTGIPLTDQYRGLPEPIEILKPDYDLYRAPIWYLFPY